KYIRIENVDCNYSGSIYIRNLGTDDLNCSELSLYLNDTQVKNIRCNESSTLIFGYGKIVKLDTPSGLNLVNRKIRIIVASKTSVSSNDCLSIKCNVDSDCVLSLVEVRPPCLCDLSDPAYQCVSQEYREYMQNKILEVYGEVVCSPCAPPTEVVKCICKNGICVKTSESLID
ncbi:MAG: hypothetical protein JSV92_02080, partial [archaeon]